MIGLHWTLKEIRHSFSNLWPSRVIYLFVVSHPSPIQPVSTVIHFVFLKYCHSIVANYMHCISSKLTRGDTWSLHYCMSTLLPSTFLIIDHINNCDLFLSQFVSCILLWFPKDLFVALELLGWNWSLPSQFLFQLWMNNFMVADVTWPLVWTFVQESWRFCSVEDFECKTLYRVGKPSKTSLGAEALVQLGAINCICVPNCFDFWLVILNVLLGLLFGGFLRLQLAFSGLFLWCSLESVSSESFD